MTEHHHVSWIEKEAKRDEMKLSERGGEAIGVIAVVLVALFFYAHEAQATGFFTASFGSIEAFMLYGSIFAGVTGPVARFAIGRRNVARPIEMLTSLFYIIGSAWLLLIFPFNFAHLGDVMPDLLRFLVSWITNDIGRVIIILGIVGGLVGIALNAIFYTRVKSILQFDRSL